MSIKLSIKDLKDLLKIQNKQIKKHKRKNKRKIKNTNDNINYNKSSSDHMKSIGFTNTSNEATELIRLQRQTLEDKLKADKENKIKDEEKEKEMGSQMIPFGNNGGSNNMRRNADEITPNVLNYIFNNLGGGEVKMVPHGHAGDPNIQKNAFVEELPTPIKTPKGKTKIPKTPEQPKTPEPVNFYIDIDDETLNTKVNDTTKPDNNYLNTAMSNINPRKLPKNKTDTNNILPTRTRGQAAFDIGIDDGTLNTKVNDTTAPLISVTKDLADMTKNELIAFINEKSSIKHGSLIQKDKNKLLQLAQAL